MRRDDHRAPEPTSSAGLGRPAVAMADDVRQGRGQSQDARSRRVRAAPEPATSYASRPARLDIRGECSISRVNVLQ